MNTVSLRQYSQVREKETEPEDFFRACAMAMHELITRNSCRQYKSGECNRQIGFFHFILQFISFILHPFMNDEISNREYDNIIISMSPQISLLL